MPAVTSRQHAIVKEFRAVARGDRSHLLLDGWHLLAEAAAAGLIVPRVAIQGATPAGYQKLLDDLAGNGARVTRVSVPVMSTLSPVRTPSGVVAIAHRPMVEADALAAPAPAFVIAGFGIQDPGNLGAVIRAAEAGGATGAVFDRASADPWSWKALRASMGSALRLPVRRDPDAAGTIAAWRRAGFSIVAAHPRGAVEPRDVDFTVPTVLLLGGEGTGLSDEVLEMASLRAAVPMKPPVESLNVAVAAALLVYEARRQRG